MSASLRSPPSRAGALFYVWKPVSQETSLAELSRVQVRVQASAYDTGASIPVGAVGTIVIVHDGGAAYDVEFSEPAGIASLSRDQVSPVSR